MSTLAGMTVEQQLLKVQEVINQKEWLLTPVDGTTFVIDIYAADNTLFSLQVDCKKYPAIPPAFHWRCPKTGVLDRPEDTPAANSGFFHGKGLICAPWNRLAYTSENAKGPHGDWETSSWLKNSYTKGCTTLAAMLLRIDFELKNKYQGRMK